MSSVLIKGMKKPTACYKCPLRTGKYCGILTENEKCADDGVLPHCPLVEIPPHGRLIDADETKRVFGDYFEKIKVARRYAESLVDNAIPTVIESEEQEMPRFYVENKGKWNIYSTIVDDYLIDGFVDFKELKAAVIGEMVVERNEELDTLLTDQPRLNVMPYKEAEEKRKLMNGGEEQEHE